MSLSSGIRLGPGEVRSPRGDVAAVGASTRLFVVGAVLLAAAGLGAQTTGDIRGRVTDSTGAPLADAIVEVEGAKMQGSRRGASAHDGTYRVLAVPAGAYRVRGSRAGFRAVEKPVTVSLDATATVDFELAPAAAESVTVVADGESLDLASTTTGSSYTERLVARLPVARNYADVVRANPGVGTDNAQGQGRSLKLTVYGATSAENAWIVDGINTTNVMKGFQGKAIASEFVDEVEVKTGGYGAEYGRALGGVVNVITKSGGNALRGDAFLYGQAGSWRADQKVTSEDSTAGIAYAPTRRLDYGADLGGPILKDRLWFFGAYNRVDTPGVTSNLFSTPAVPSSMEFPRDQTDSLYAGKLTWSPAPSTNVVATAFSDPSHIGGNASGTAVVGPGVSANTIVNPDPSTWEAENQIGAVDVGLRLTQLLGASGLLTAQAALHQDRFHQFATPASSGVRTEDWTCAGGTLESPCAFPIRPNDAVGGLGSVGGRDANTSRREEYRVDGVLSLGPHEVKAGAGLERTRTQFVSSITGGQLVQVLNQYGFTFFRHTAFVKSLGDWTPGDYASDARSTDVGWYVQDSWRPGPNWTINAGLRFDQQDAKSPSGARLFKTAPVWQPRLGVVWDPSGKGDAKVYAFAGRFSFPLPTSLSVFSYGVTTFVSTLNFDPVDLKPDDSIPNSIVPIVVGGSSEPVDQGLRGAYQDELLVGFEARLDPTLTVGVKGTYRRLGRFIEDRCDLDFLAPGNGYSTCAIINPGSDGRYAQGDFANCTGFDNESTPCGGSGAAPAGSLRRLYRGIEILARKTIGDALWLQASYSFSSLRGNFDGGINENYPLLYPGANVDRDYPAFSHNDYGPLYLDRPHSFRFDGSWTSPWKVFVGLQASVQSGAPLSRMGYFNFNYNFFYGGSQIFLVPRGTAGRLPALWEASLTAGYPIAIGPAIATVQAYVFNLFNRQGATWKSPNYTTSQPPGYPATLYDPVVPPEAVSPDYGKVLARQEPRLFRLALRVSFWEARRRPVRSRPARRPRAARGPTAHACARS